MASIIKVDEKTPSGGDYSIAFYTDQNGEPAEPEVATNIMINEYLSDGTLINTTYAKAN